MEKINTKIKEMNIILKSGGEIIKAFAKYQMIDEENLLDKTWKNFINELASWNKNKEIIEEKTFSSRMRDHMINRNKFKDFINAAAAYNKTLRSEKTFTVMANDLEDLKSMVAKYSKTNIKEVSKGFDLEKMTSL